MIVFVFILGACVGSFVACLTDRFLEKKAIFALRSQCFSCGKTLEIWHLVPIFSFMFLKGKCAFCKSSLSVSLIFLEFITAFCFVYAYLLSFNSFHFAFLALFLSLLILLSSIDFKLKAVPGILLFLAFFSAFALAFFENKALFFPLDTPQTSFFLDAFCLAGMMFLLKSFVSCLMNLKKQRQIIESMGDGDVLFLACLGGVLGFELGFLAIFLACVLSLPFFILAKFKGEKSPQIPMIPFFSLAFILCYFLGNFYEISL